MVEAQVTWTDGERFVGNASSGHAIVIDADRQRARVALRGGDAPIVDVDAGVVDHSIHPANRVDLPGHTVSLLSTREIADHHSRGANGQLRGARSASGVEDDLMAAVKKRASRCQAKPLRGPGDQDSSHALGARWRG